MRISLLAAVLCLALPLTASADTPTATPARTIVIGDQFNSSLVRPRIVHLWVSDALVNLRWSRWGRSSATARGQVTTHSQGVYSRSAASVRVSRPRKCGGHTIYTRFRYKAFGRWSNARLNECRFSG